LVHVVPATQVVGPVYPIPPHCPHLATVPVGVADADDDLVVVVVVVLLTDGVVDLVVLGDVVVVERVVDVFRVLEVREGDEDEDEGDDDDDEVLELVVDVDGPEPAATLPEP